MDKIKRNIPNILTVLRLIAVPIFSIFISRDQLIVGATIFILAEITDCLDGYIARKYNLISSFGKLADPVADKLLQLTALLMLYAKGKILPVIVMIFLGKEVLMLLGGLYFLNKKIVVSSKWYGKLASVLLFVAIIMSIFQIQGYYIALWSAVFVTVFAFIMYGINYFKFYSNTKKQSGD